MEDKRSLHSIPDEELLQRLAELASHSRRVEVDIVAHIAEVDERRIYAREAFSSMFVYCTDALRFSEQEAYLRIAVARASREHPMLLAMLADGRLHLTAIGKLAPHLTRENRDRLLERAAHRSKRQVEELIAEIAPRPDVPAVVRKLPERSPEPTLGLRPHSVAQLGPDRVGPDASPRLASPSAPAIPLSTPVVEPLSPGRYKIQFTASAEFKRKLERLRALMGKGPQGDLAAVIEQAVTEKLERLEASRFAQTKAPRKGPAVTNPSRSSRHIPAAVRRAVYARDGGRCRYVDEKGRRCPERDRFEYHHGHPYGLGGDHGVTNIRLMCRAHNGYLAERDYGQAAMASHRQGQGRAADVPG